MALARTASRSSRRLETSWVSERLELKPDNHFTNLPLCFSVPSKLTKEQFWTHYFFRVFQVRSTYRPSRVGSPLTHRPCIFDSSRSSRTSAVARPYSRRPSPNPRTRSCSPGMMRNPQSRPRPRVPSSRRRTFPTRSRRFPPPPTRSRPPSPPRRQLLLPLRTPRSPRRRARVIRRRATTLSARQAVVMPPVGRRAPRGVLRT